MPGMESRGEFQLLRCLLPVTIASFAFLVSPAAWTPASQGDTISQRAHDLHFDGWPHGAPDQLMLRREIEVHRRPFSQVASD